MHPFVFAAGSKSLNLVALLNSESSPSGNRMNVIPNPLGGKMDPDNDVPDTDKFTDELHGPIPGNSGSHLGDEEYPIIRDHQ